MSLGFGLCAISSITVEVARNTRCSSRMSTSSMSASCGIPLFRNPFRGVARVELQDDEGRGSSCSSCRAKCCMSTLLASQTVYGSATTAAPSPSKNCPRHVVEGFAGCDSEGGLLPCPPLIRSSETATSWSRRVSASRIEPAASRATTEIASSSADRFSSARISPISVCDQAVRN